MSLRYSLVLEVLPTQFLVASTATEYSVCDFSFDNTLCIQLIKTEVCALGSSLPDQYDIG